jgi:hypothetical protein
MRMSSASICRTVAALKGYWEVMLRRIVLQVTPRWDPSSFSSTVANKEMAEGGSRHASCQPNPPYGWNVGIIYLVTTATAISIPTTVCHICLLCAPRIQAGRNSNSMMGLLYFSSLAMRQNQFG